jgi:hypothetical protein
MQIDNHGLIDFSTRILINRFNGLETLFLSLIYKNPRVQDQDLSWS